LRGPGRYARTTDGAANEQFTVHTGNPSWVHAGVFARVTTKGAPVNARARLWASTDGTGWVALTQRLVLEEGGSGQTLAVGAPFSAAGVTRLIFGLVYTGVSGTITAPTPCWRGFTTGDTSAPGAWTTLTAGIGAPCGVLVSWAFMA